MTIFTTGAYIEPRQLANGRWAWIVVQFEDDTFKDGPEFDTPVGYLGQDDYHAHAEQWAKNLEVQPYAPCVAVYRFENGRVVITVQGDPNKAIEVVAEAMEQDGFAVPGRTPVAKIKAIREQEEMLIFSLHMPDLPIGQVFDTSMRDFKTAPLCRVSVHARLDEEVERQRAVASVDPEVVKRWPEWAAAMALRIADEAPYREDKAALLTVLKECFTAMPQVACKLIGTEIIESNHFED